jgi:hypothetical protein
MQFAGLTGEISRSLRRRLGSDVQVTNTPQLTAIFTRTTLT